MTIRKEDLQELYPLTRMQEGMLFHALREPANPAYTEQVVWRLNEVLDIDRYQRAWDAIHARYEALRSVFTHEKTKQPLQMVLKQRAADFAAADWRELAPEEREAKLKQARADERAAGFDLARGPLLRVRVFQLGAAEFEICVTWHHILLDGWSTHLMFQDLVAFYTALGQGRAPDLPPLPAFARYVEWLNRQDIEASLAWWRGQLQDYEGFAEIPRLEPAGFQGRSAAGRRDPAPDAPPTPHRADERRSYPAVPDDSGGEGPGAVARCAFELAEAENQALQAFTARSETTLSSLLRTVWGLLLARYTDARDVVFGAVVSGRSPEVTDIERLPGLLINTVPVRVRFDPADSFAALLARVHTQALDAQTHQTCRLADVQNLTEQRADLIKHLLVVENYPLAAAPADAPALTVIESSEPTNYDLLVVADPGRRLRIELQFNPTAYDPAFVRQIAGHFRRLLVAAIAAPEAPLGALDLLSPDERDWLTTGLNATERDYPRDSHLAAQFAAIVSRHAERTAVVHQGTRLSYAELDRRSTRLARHLAAAGVRAGDRVALVLDRTPGLIEALLAVVKLGAAYVPYDPEGPAERLQFIVTDATVRAVILPATAALRPAGVRLVHPDAEAAAIEALSDAPLATPDATEGETCLFYTSGSTGTPKAVCVAQHGILRLVCNPDYLTIAPGDRLAHASNVAFDAATFEIWGALLNGAELHLIDRDTALNPSALARDIRERRLTHLFLTTALFNQMARDAADALAPLAYVMTGGEQADGGWMKRVLERGAPQHLLHMYGPTETTTYATWHRVTAAEKGVPVPIGLPIANTTAYVVDRDLRLQPPGAPGELLIGGDGVALGYLNQPALTAERFVDAPFGAGRVYRTGDIVRRRLDGVLEFIGRRDHQVKLRGFRIELGEIEAALRQFPGVGEALVIVHQDEGSDNKKLVAYLGMSGGSATIDLELRKFLKTRLPDYMIPSSFVILERLPLNAAGKIDRRALPAPSKAGTGFGKAFVAPVTETEKQVAQIWSAVLGIATVGRTDSFFELGGHSLTASTAISHIRATLKAEVPLPFFFQCPNLEALALEVERLQKEAPAKPAGITRVARTPTATTPLSPGGERGGGEGV